MPPYSQENAGGFSLPPWLKEGPKSDFKEEEAQTTSIVFPEPVTALASQIWCFPL